MELKNRNILIVEDDVEISDLVRNYLTGEGFNVKVAFDGEEGIDVFLQNDIDLILLDIMMPKMDGMEFLRIVREKTMVPILIMSAKGTDIDKAIGLGIGADDYIAKPFSLIELSARVKASIRRATRYSSISETENKVIRFGKLEIDIEKISALKDGIDLKLTSKEFDILKLFLQNPGKVFTKSQIYSSIWNDDYFGDDNVINVHVRRLREKIEDNPSNPVYIKTLWGIGYKLGEEKND